MRFTIGYGVSGDEFFDDTLLMGDGVMVNQLEIPCPKLPKEFKVERIVHVLGDNLQASMNVIEISSLNELLTLSRKMGCNLILERQSQEMLNAVGAILPEFCIVIEEN
jgi:hypothetical protein